MHVDLDGLLSARIKMNVNGHRFVTGARIDHPASSEPTEYAVYKAGDDYLISIDSGNDPRVGRLSAGTDAAAGDEAVSAVDDYFNVNPRFWQERAVSAP